jgi:hypothetical protein
LVGDADAVAFEGYYLFGMVGQDTDVFQAQVDQDLSAYAAFVLDHALASGFAVDLATLVKVDLGEAAGGRVCRLDGEAAAGVMEIEENATAFLGDSFERTGDELAAIAGD